MPMFAVDYDEDGEDESSSVIIEAETADDAIKAFYSDHGPEYYDAYYIS